MSQRPDPGPRSVFLPVLLLALAVIAGVGFQAVQLAGEYRRLSAAAAALEPQQQAAVKLRGALDALADATARLANEGNPNARALVDELRRRGVTLRAQNAASPASSAR